MACLGQLELTIRDGTIVRHAFRRHPVSAASPADPRVKAELDRYAAR
jgi:hypothetical protein